ncbi:MAG: alpha/beta hydrolase [Bdellovibrionales bacterium]|nr:alpha/beta hydrolase [Bdellovibrionales bacterium]
MSTSTTGKKNNSAEAATELLKAWLEAPGFRRLRERFLGAAGPGLATWDWVRLKLPIKAVQALTLPVFRRLGYRFEVQSVGDLKLGLLRRTFHRGKKAQGLRRLVFLPGFGDSPTSWLPVFALLQPALRRRFDEVVLVEFPGSMGLLSEERAFNSMDRQHEVVFDLLDGLRPQVIFGHSLGAWLAAAYAIACGKGERPTKASLQYAGPQKILLASPSGVLADESKKELWLGKFRKAQNEGSAHFREFIFGKEPFWFGAVASSFMGFLDKPEVREFMDSVAEKHLVTDHLGAIGSKTWVLWGAKDGLVPAEWVHDWLERLNHLEPTDQRAKRGLSHGVVIQGVGHSPHLERPVTTAAAVGKILLGQPFQPPTAFWKRHGWHVHGA